MMSQSIIKLKNVLSDDERRHLIKESKKFLISKKTLDELFQKDHPCDQTTSSLHRFKNFDQVHYKILERIIKETGQKFVICGSWVNKLTNKNSSISYWHTHNNSHLSVVYYARKVPFIHKGTLFEKEGLIECSQNSAIVFPSDMKHTVPNNYFPLDRYTLALELLYS
tara:strand:+ start:54 stop:554 length:501 start_codon:yes stop_codon:yes gene_type:complete